MLAYFFLNVEALFAYWRTLNKLKEAIASCLTMDKSLEVKPDGGSGHLAMASHPIEICRRDPQIVRSSSSAMNRVNPACLNRVISLILQRLSRRPPPSAFNPAFQFPLRLVGILAGTIPRENNSGQQEAGGQRKHGSPHRRAGRIVTLVCVCPPLNSLAFGDSDLFTAGRYSGFR